MQLRMTKADLKKRKWGSCYVTGAIIIIIILPRCGGEFKLLHNCHSQQAKRIR
jgi:hypothetical protein